MTEKKELYDIFELIYPVGIIINLTIPTNPKDLFGIGEWEQIKGRFLFGVDDSHAAETTGGEAEHTLNINEMPLHTHSQLVSGYSGWPEGTSCSYVLNWDTSTDVILNKSTSLTTFSHLAHGDTGIITNGNSQPHNNMPPYLAVYMWKRIK